MVEESQRRYENGQTFGPNEASKYLTYLRHTVKDENGVLWLSAYSSKPQQQTVRDFSASRKKALLDRKNKERVRRGLPGYKSRRRAQLTLNYNGNGFKLVEIGGALRLKLTKGTIIPVVWSSARAKRRLGLQDRVYKCECCGFVLDRDRNSAINMLIGAGFIPGPIGTLSRSGAAVHGRAVPTKAKIPRL